MSKVKNIFGNITFFVFIIIIPLLREAGPKIWWEKLLNIQYLWWTFLAILVLEIVAWRMTNKKWRINLKLVAALSCVVWLGFFFKSFVNVNILFKNSDLLEDPKNQRISVDFVKTGSNPYPIPDAQTQLYINGEPVDKIKGIFDPRKNWGLVYIRKEETPWDFGCYEAQVFLRSSLAGERNASMKFVVGYFENFSAFPTNDWRVDFGSYNFPPFESGILLKPEKTRAGAIAQLCKEFRGNLWIEFKARVIQETPSAFRGNIAIYLDRRYTLIIGDGNDRRVSLKINDSMNPYVEDWREIDVDYLREGLRDLKEFRCWIAIYQPNILYFVLNIPGAGALTLCDTLPIDEFMSSGVRPGIGVMRGVEGILFRDFHVHNLRESEEGKIKEMVLGLKD